MTRVECTTLNVRATSRSPRAGSRFAVVPGVRSLIDDRVEPSCETRIDDAWPVVLARRAGVMMAPPFGGWNASQPWRTSMQVRCGQPSVGGAIPDRRRYLKWISPVLFFDSLSVVDVSDAGVVRTFCAGEQSDSR